MSWIIYIHFFQDFDTVTIVIWNGIMTNLCCYVFLSFDGNSRIFFLGEIDSATAGGWVVISLVSIIGVVLHVASYQLLDPTICSIFKSQEVVFAYIIQAIVMDFVPCYISFIGSSMVVLSAVFISLEIFIVPKLSKIFWNIQIKISAWDSNSMDYRAFLLVFSISENDYYRKILKWIITKLRNLTFGTKSYS